jgi:hypothetical protein
MENFYCATWHDLTPSKIDYSDSLCILKTQLNKNICVITCHFVISYNIIANFIRMVNG